MSDSLIKIDNLVKYFEAGDDVVYAVNGVSIEIGKGDFVTVMGPSGSGKSTLLTTLGGLSEPSSGKVYIDGFDIYSLSSKQLAALRREYLGFVFQSFQLIPYLTVKENVMVPMLEKDEDDISQEKKAEDVLDWVGLKNKQNRLINELSGGEQQRVAIARSLINDPAIILADEPTGNLDVNTGEQIMNVFKELNNQGKTIIIVTHNEEYRYISDYTIDLQDGHIVNRELKQEALEINEN